jgi:hypothetical protein
MQLTNKHRLPLPIPQPSDQAQADAQVAQGKLSDGAVKMGSRLFKNLDLDHDGFVSRSHLAALLTQVFYHDKIVPPPIEQVRVIVSDYKVDYSKVLSKKSFKRLLKDLSGVLHASKLSPSAKDQYISPRLNPGARFSDPVDEFGEMSESPASQIPWNNYKHPLHGATSQSSCSKIFFGEEQVEQQPQNRQNQSNLHSSFDRSFGIEDESERQESR